MPGGIGDHDVATRLAKQVAAGLRFLHEQVGLVHRRLCSKAVMMCYDQYYDERDNMNAVAKISAYESV